MNEFVLNGVVKRRAELVDNSGRMKRLPITLSLAAKPGE
jgi:hypothetical protein